MRSRLRRVVILGPPLVMILAAGSGLRSTPPARAGTMVESTAAGAPLAPCVAAGPHQSRGRSPDDRAWWDQRPDIDADGSLTGWTLTVGLPGERLLSMPLPVASVVSGPDDGRIVASVDDGANSAIQVIDTAARCSRTYPIADVIVRRAISVPGDDAVVAHLLDRAARDDLGIWRVPLDGSPRTRLLGPPEPALLEGAGIDRVWATDLRLSADGSRLAVQSCDPDACVTRVLGLVTGAIATIGEAHGSLVGVTGTTLVTRAACAGVPCDIVGWDLGSGRAGLVEAAAVGAAISPDGRVVVIRRLADGSTAASVVDPGANRSSGLGSVDDGSFPLDGSGTTGIETRPDAVGLSHAGGPPSALPITVPLATNRGARP
ncbi:MAG: hypothetical protein EPO00_05980 [Chloroflexota bacterium]|nr:MAG: hypothetical protein EPO00_05980 [Chloroflexota bacterium]